jgi:outer membrane putative beta-barrel porin/alpha-amylase
MRGRRPAALVAIGASIGILSLTPVAAQTQDESLSGILPELILREIILQRGQIGPPHIAHFSPIEGNDANNPAVGIVQAFNNQLATQFATFPLGSSTGGLTYVFDESLGTLRRGSASFGPLFAERALTIGRGKLSAGFNYQRTPYSTFEGKDLHDGSIKFYLRHQDCCGFADPANLAGFSSTVGDGTRLNPPFEGDIIEAALSLKATTHTTALFANYGLTSRWDVGLAVPFVKVSLDASVEARIIRLVTATAPDTHTFEYGNPNGTLVVQRAGSAAGIGDIVLRSKYRVLSGAGGGLAAAVDLRLPTGDENDLLGTGGFQAKVLLIASTEHGRIAQHVNFGYTVSEGDGVGAPLGLTAAAIPDEINYSGGVEFMPSSRVTVMADFVGRTLQDAGRLVLASKQFQYVDPAISTFDPAAPVGCGGFRGTQCSVAAFDEFDPRHGNLTLLLGTGGVKFNPFGNLLVSAAVLFPLNDAGLRSQLTTTVGIDYAF